MNFFNKYKIHLVFLFAFTLITFFYFPKLFTGFFSHVETNDGRLVAWILSWDIHKLLTDPFHIYQANTFYPNANTLSYSEHFIGTSLLGIPVWLLTGGNPAATFNFVMIFGFVSNAFFTFLLIKRFVKSNSIAFLGAFINGYCSYRLWNIGHLQNIVVFYIPLCLLLLFLYMDTKKPKYLVGIGLCLLLQSLSSWYHMIFIFMMFFLFVAFYYIRGKRISNKDLIKMGVMLFAVVLLFLPFAIPYLKQNSQNQTAYAINDIISGDLGGYLMPPPYTALHGINTNYFGITKSRWLENFNYIGYVALLLSCYGLYKAYRRKTEAFQLRNEMLLFLFIAIVFFIFSLGPYLTLNDNTTSLKLPYYFIFNYLSPIRFLRVTARYSTVIFLMVSLLASIGLATLLKDASRKIYRSAIVVLLLIVVFIEYTPIEKFDRFTDMSEVPVVYEQIKKDTSVKALIELPINVDPFTTTKYIYYAGIHFKPIVNGYSGYEPPSYNLFKNAFDAPLNPVTQALLTSIGVTHIVAHPDYQVPLDTSFVQLEKNEKGIRLYKVKAAADVDLYMEPIAGWQKGFETFSNLIQLSKKGEGVAFNPANPHTIVANISPEKVNTPATLTYNAAQPLDSLYIKFRAYAPTDTLKVECFIAEKGKEDHLAQTYVFTNNSNYLKDFAILDLAKATKIKITLFATEFADRTFISDLIFINQD